MKSICRSKSEVYNLLRYGLKIYLPKYKSCPFEFCRDLLNGAKNPTYKEKINAVDVPKWPELSVARVYEWAFDHDKLKHYLPDFSEYFIIFFITVISYNIDRQWLFNVIETNKPGSLSEKVDQQKRKREDER